MNTSDLKANDNDKMLFSSKKANCSFDHIVSYCVSIFGFVLLSFGIGSEFYEYFLDEHANLSIKELYLFFIDFPFLMFAFMVFIMLKCFFIPLIYDSFGTEVIYIDNNYVTINKHAFFLHKTTTVKISQIVKMSYIYRKMFVLRMYSHPDYEDGTIHTIHISYYSEHHILKKDIICGMNYSKDEQEKFISTLEKLIGTNKNNI